MRVGVQRIGNLQTVTHEPVSNLAPKSLTSLKSLYLPALMSSSDFFIAPSSFLSANNSTVSSRLSNLSSSRWSFVCVVVMWKYHSLENRLKGYCHRFPSTYHPSKDDPSEAHEPWQVPVE